MKLHIDQDGIPHLDGRNTIMFTRNDACFTLSQDDPGLGYFPCGVHFKDIWIVGTHGTTGKISRFWHMAKYLWRFAR